MAAITPHLEQQDDPSETEAERRYSESGTYDDRVAEAEGEGLGAAAIYPITREAQALMQTSHAELMRLAYTRKASLKELAGRTITVTPKTRRNGTGEVLLVLDQPIRGALWNPAGAGNMRKFRMLSWTQKMGTPSFSLPAGAPHFGGTCPGATGGQSIVPEASLLKGQRDVERITGKPVILPDAICERCYATGGNYAYGSMVLAQGIRDIWARQAVADGTFVDTMSWAVEHAEYLLDGGEVGSGKKIVNPETGEITIDTKVSYDKERFPGRYFRIHDSGDFFNPEYIRAWKEVANNFRTGRNRVTFWAPTRVWATTWGIDAVKKYNSDEGSNLIIRPSTYHINESDAPILGAGFSQWSVCWNKKVKDSLLQYPDRDRTGGAGVPVEDGRIEKPFNWDCQAYAVVDEAHSCRNARGPKDTRAGANKDLGCRACWVNPESSVNYTEH